MNKNGNGHNIFRAVITSLMTLTIAAMIGAQIMDGRRAAAMEERNTSQDYQIRVLSARIDRLESPK